MLWTLFTLLSNAAQAADCKGFSGLIHGRSSCVRYKRSSGTVKPINDRVMPDEVTVNAGCDAALVLEGVKARIECSRGEQNFEVWLVVESDERYAFSEERRMKIGENADHFAFLNIWVQLKPTQIDMTLDFALLD